MPALIGLFCASLLVFFSFQLKFILRFFISAVFGANTSKIFSWSPRDKKRPRWNWDPVLLTNLEFFSLQQFYPLPMLLCFVSCMFGWRIFQSFFFTIYFNAIKWILKYFSLQFHTNIVYYIFHTRIALLGYNWNVNFSIENIILFWFF